MLAESYQQCCDSRGVTPRPEVAQMDGGSLSLPGNTFDRFHVRLTDSDVEAIVEATEASGAAFVDVFLPYNSIGSAGAKSLATAIASSGCLNSITVLDLSFNNIDSTGGIELCKGLASNTSIMDLRLSGNPLGSGSGGEAFGYALREALTANSTLTHLDLYSSDLGMKALVPIAGALADNKGLVSLNLGKPLLSSPDDARYVVHHLALSLTFNKTLREMELSYFNLFDDNLHHLLPSLCASGIVSINLKANKLSQDAGELCSRLLGRREDFVSIDVSANRLCDAGAIHLATAISTHPHFQGLYLDHASIGVVGITALAEALVKCRALRAISLWGNELEGASAVELYRIKDRIDQLEYVDFDFQVVDDVPAVFKK